MTLHHVLFAVSNVNALLMSREMASLVSSSRDVVFSAGCVVAHSGGLALHLACLPFTIPIRVAATTANVLLGTADMMFAAAGDALIGTTGELMRHISLDSHPSPPSGGESTSSVSPFESFKHNLTNFFPTVVDTAGRITQDIGSNALGILAPFIGFGTEGGEGNTRNPSRSTNTSSGESTAENESFLDRLKLDISKPKILEEPIDPSPVASSDYSKYLLRVDDLNIEASPEPASRCESLVMYIDLSKDFSDDQLTIQSMNKLVDRGLSIVSSLSHAGSMLPVSNDSTADIEWKPELSTSHLLRKKELERQNTLRTQVLAWSGSYKGPKYYGSDYPFFLAQGIVPISPLGLLRMLWDSTRTGEYNKYCLGRSDVVIVQDDILSGGSCGTKVIKSETKVPFTGMSVTMSVCMHARALDGLNGGYVIVSRSLNCGVAGSHVGSSRGVEKGSTSEILIGVNLLLPLPDGNCNLISVSQVSANLVPPFLAKKIGLMGVQDFFNNVRSMSTVTF